MAVVKNNAYGHGLKEISEYLDKDERIIYLVVNNIKEALYLRNNNILFFYKTDSHYLCLFIIIYKKTHLTKEKLNGYKDIKVI